MEKFRKVKSAPLRWLCGIQQIIRIFSQEWEPKSRLPRKLQFQASKYAASQGRPFKGHNPIRGRKQAIFLHGVQAFLTFKGHNPIRGRKHDVVDYHANEDPLKAITPSGDGNAHS